MLVPSSTAFYSFDHLSHSSSGGLGRGLSQSANIQMMMKPRINASIKSRSIAGRYKGTLTFIPIYTIA